MKILQYKNEHGIKKLRELVLVRQNGSVSIWMIQRVEKNYGVFS